MVFHKSFAIIILKFKNSNIRKWKNSIFKPPHILNKAFGAEASRYPVNPLSGSFQYLVLLILLLFYPTFSWAILHESPWSEMAHWTAQKLTTNGLFYFKFSGLHVCPYFWLTLNWVFFYFTKTSLWKSYLFQNFKGSLFLTAWS